ncbi:TetR/AcrR family transcriptional regulator [Aestuariivita sp.]|jgi:AcrR family transcriptional regulator|uniref:TetR/AcrR family transcriptional regulator n=1 Tax=Aestuariivita sp. TaxID=1872407 RepID=UPI00216D3873|nr:TetR/AcrR family transcriptional regulator [Aestuariivita sp.]MCE8005591.1 TetR/AcrR family transcriptional regulator [Aestuariivita sp.]
MSQIDTMARRAVSRGDRDGAQIWVLGALNTIARDGVDAVRVERLAREIGVSKGSFYWFFASIDDLLARSLDHWKTHLNDAVFAQIRNLDGPVMDRMCRLIDTVFQSRLGRYDAAIRAWAMKDPRVQTVVGTVDRERLSFLVEIFSESGMSDQTARNRAHLFYRALIAESYLGAYPGASVRDAYLKELLAELLSATLETPIRPSAP